MNPILQEIEVTCPAEAVYALLAQEPYSVFLDSALDVHGLGRYSYIVREPFLIFSSKGRQVVLEDKNGRHQVEGDPLVILKTLLNTYRTERVDGYPPFTGGAIGYFGYDLAYLIETKIPGSSQDDLNLPDCCLGFYDTVLIFDHHTGKSYIASTGFPELNHAARLDRARVRAAEIASMINSAKPLASPASPVPRGEYQSNFSRGEYCQAVKRALDYIAAGDIFQVNLSQRFKAKLTVSPYELYRYLRQISPAPFAAYLNFGNVVVASASPERYLLVHGKWVETRPIKGTRPRGNDAQADRRFREELQNSDKDKAELVMIIDLERNDLGRVCEYGSVKVPDLIRLEEYATVFHLVSTVTGTLSADNDVIDLLMASFPGGSITGAPKVRAMEIIDELEPVRRAIYTGSIGYIDFNGDADLNIIIRTFVIKDGQAYFQVGGGIVADSDPDLEYQETLTKAKALIRALGYQG